MLNYYINNDNKKIERSIKNAEEDECYKWFSSGVIKSGKFTSTIQKIQPNLIYNFAVAYYI